MKLITIHFSVYWMYAVDYFNDGLLGAALAHVPQTEFGANA